MSTLKRMADAKQRRNQSPRRRISSYRGRQKPASGGTAKPKDKQKILNRIKKQPAAGPKKPIKPGDRRPKKQPVPKKPLKPGQRRPSDRNFSIGRILKRRPAKPKSRNPLKKKEGGAARGGVQRAGTAARKPTSKRNRYIDYRSYSSRRQTAAKASASDRRKNAAKPKSGGEAKVKKSMNKMDSQFKKQKQYAKKNKAS